MVCSLVQTGQVQTDTPCLYGEVGRWQRSGPSALEREGGEMARSRHPSAVEQEDGAGGGDMARCWNREVHVVVRGPGGEVMKARANAFIWGGPEPPRSSRRVVVVVTWPGPGRPSVFEQEGRWGDEARATALVSGGQDPPRSSGRVVEVVVTWPGPGGPCALESTGGR